MRASYILNRVKERAEDAANLARAVSLTLSYKVSTTAERLQESGAEKLERLAQGIASATENLRYGASEAVDEVRAFVTETVPDAASDASGAASEFVADAGYAVGGFLSDTLFQARRFLDANPDTDRMLLPLTSYARLIGDAFEEFLEALDTSVEVQLEPQGESRWTATYGWSHAAESGAVIFSTVFNASPLTNAFDRTFESARGSVVSMELRRFGVIVMTTVQNGETKTDEVRLGLNHWAHATGPEGAKISVVRCRTRDTSPERPYQLATFGPNRARSQRSLDLF